MTAVLSPLAAITAATRSAVAADPANAEVVFTARATSAHGVASTVTTGPHSFTVDEPPALGGAGSAPNPVEYYLASLLSCHVVTYRLWADRLGIEVGTITATAEGDLDVRGFFGFDDLVRPGFTAVRITVEVTGPRDQEEQLRLREAVEAHCPVLDLTRNATPVTYVAAGG